jgi:hypothetical protein
VVYIRPSRPGINDDWDGHRGRRPPSSEPGVDYDCAIGDSVVAPADGVIHSVKLSTSGASGRAIMLRTGRDWHRALHLSRILVRPGDRVSQGQVIAKTGASANGRERGVGPHLHWSFWFDRGNSVPTPGLTPTDDFERFIDSPRIAGVGPEEDPMFTEQDRALLLQIKNELLNTKAGVWTGGRVKLDGVVQEFRYGVLPIVAHNQRLIAQQAGQIAALQAIVEQLTVTQNVSLDMGAVRDAAERGTRDANAGLLNGVDVVAPALDQDPAIDEPFEGGEGRGVED